MYGYGTASVAHVSVTLYLKAPLLSRVSLQVVVWMFLATLSVSDAIPIQFRGQKNVNLRNFHFLQIPPPLLLPQDVHQVC